MPKYTCPYCFTAVDLSRILFLCSSATCSEPNERRTRFELGLEEEQPLPPETSIKQYTTVFQGTSPTSREGVCPKPDCRRKTNIRVCPNCLSPFPPGIEGLSNTVIAVVGARETGKSHYIAVLIEQIKRLYRKFGWTLSALNDETMSNYRQYFYNPLYLDNESLKQTQTAMMKDNAYLKVPLLYSLDFHDRNKTVVLAFFDAAGEDLESERQMRITNRYISNASGIIVLLDPLLINKIRSRVHTDNLPSKGIIPYHQHMLNLLANLVISEQKLPRGSGTIKTPLAVVFSKIDMLRDVMKGEEYRRLVTPVPHQKGVLNLDDIESKSEFIEDWFDSQENGLLQGCGTFANVRFFGVSALGQDPVVVTENDPVDGKPKERKKIPGGPIPIQVEDPFLWLLHMNDVIHGK